MKIVQYDSYKVLSDIIFIMKSIFQMKFKTIKSKVIIEKLLFRKRSR